MRQGLITLTEGSKSAWDRFEQDSFLLRLRDYRLGLVLGGVLWIAMWLLPTTLDPTTQDSLLFRLAIACQLWLVALLSLRPTVWPMMPRLLAGVLAIANGGAFLLMAVNHLHPIYTILLIAHTASAGLVVDEGRDHAWMAGLNLLLLGLTWGIVSEPQVPLVVVLLGLLTVDLAGAITHMRIEQRTDGIQARNRLLDTVFSSAGDAMLLLSNRTGQVIQANAEAARLLGVAAPEALLGRAAQALYGPLLDPQHRPLPPSHGIQHGTASCHRDGQAPFWADATVARSDDSGVTIVRLTDATARQAHERALEAARDEAQAGVRARDTFLALVSHELKTPLNGLLGVLSLLRRDAPSAELPLEEALQTMEDSARRLEMRVLQVLSYSAVLGGTVSQPVPTDLAGLLQHMQVETGGRYRLTLDPKLPPLVLVDPGLLRTVLLQLLENTDQHAASADVHIRVSPCGPESIALSVEDSGPGIDERAMAMLLAPLALDEVQRRVRGGMGLGLPLCQRLLESAGGTLLVLPRPEGGTCVTVILPAPTASTAAPLPTTCQDLSDRRVLIVEDDATNRLVLRTMLRRLGVQIIEASDGEAGIRAAEQEAPALILMDLHMPGCTGWEAATAIRDRLSEPPPIVAITASTAPDDHAAARAAGMLEILAKPIQPAELERVLQHYTAHPAPQASAAR